MDLFKLVGSVFIDTNEAENSLSKVDGKAEGTGKKFADMAGKAGKAALGIGAAAVGAGAALFKMAEGAAQTADEIDKGSLRMGISTDSFQELKYAAGQCGVEMSTLEKAAKKLEGTELNFDQAIEQIMSLGTAEERSAMAAELFGDNVAYQLSPILEGTGEQFSGLRDRAHELGLVMSEESVAAGVTMGDTMSDIQQSLGAVGTQIGAQFMPVVQGVLDWIMAHMPEIQAAVGNVITFVQNLIADLTPVIENLKPVVEAVFQGIVTIWESVLKPVLDGISLFLKGVFTQDWTMAFEGLKNVVSTAFGALVGLIKAPLNAVIDTINSFIGKIGSISVPDWFPVIGGKTFSVPKIPHLAKGGTLEAPGTVMVGEEGAELLELPAGAKVTPLNGGLDKKIDALLMLCEKYMPNIGSDIILDTGALVGNTVAAYDTALGKRRSMKARGI